MVGIAHPRSYWPSSRVSNNAELETAKRGDSFRILRIRPSHSALFVTPHNARYAELGITGIKAAG